MTRRATSSALLALRECTAAPPQCSCGAGEGGACVCGTSVGGGGGQDTPVEAVQPNCIQGIILKG